MQSAGFERQRALRWNRRRSRSGRQLGLVVSDAAETFIRLVKKSPLPLVRYANDTPTRNCQENSTQACNSAGIEWSRPRVFGRGYEPLHRQNFKITLAISSTKFFVNYAKERIWDVSPIEKKQLKVKKRAVVSRWKSILRRRVRIAESRLPRAFKGPRER